MRTIEHDIDRIMQRWFNRLRPATIIRELLKDWPLSVITTDLQGVVPMHSLNGRTLFISDQLDLGQSNEAIAAEWMNFRIHKQTGHPPGEEAEEFVAEFVRDFLLPASKLELSKTYRELHWAWVRGEADLEPYIANIAEDFVCTNRLVRECIEARGYLKP